MNATSSAVIITSMKQMFDGLDRVLEKAASHCAEKGIEESVLLNWRLAPDMFAMARQVQIATSIPIRGLVQLSGGEWDEIADTEKSFAELRARVEKAREIISGLSQEAIDADPEGLISIAAGGQELTFPRGVLLVNFVLPNFYFHVTAAYTFLRAAGVEIGKRDYLAAPG